MLQNYIPVSYCINQIYNVYVQELVSFSCKSQHCIGPKPHAAINTRGKMDPKERKVWVWNLTRTKTFLAIILHRQIIDMSFFIISLMYCMHKFLLYGIFEVRSQINVSITVTCTLYKLVMYSFWLTWWNIIPPPPPPLLTTYRINVPIDQVTFVFF